MRKICEQMNCNRTKNGLRAKICVNTSVNLKRRSLKRLWHYCQLQDTHTGGAWRLHQMRSEIPLFCSVNAE